MIDFFGLDIGNYKIKVAQVEYRKDKPVLVSIGESNTPNGTIGTDSEEQQKLLATSIKQAVHDAGISTKKLVAALPEISITSRLEVGFPKLSEDALNEAIIYEAKKYISYPIEEMQLDKVILSEREVAGEKKVDVFWVATSKANVDRFTKVCKIAGFEPLALETECIATARALKSFANATETVVVVDVGSNGTEVAVIRGGLLLSSQTVGVGSDAITRTIENSFAIDYIKAEEIKRTYGINREVAGGKIAQVIEPAINLLFTEINKTINFFRAKLPESAPSKIFFVGDGGRMPGLVEESNKVMKIESFVVNSFKSVAIDGKLKDEIKRFSGIGFNVAIGLALKTDK